jgi:hypothetical protein
MNGGKKIPNGFLTESFAKSIGGLLSSYLWLGDTDKMKLYMSILKEITDVNEKLWYAIPPKDLERIKIIGKAFKANEIPFPWKSQIKMDEKESKELFASFSINIEDDQIQKEIKEKNIQNMIYRTQESISFLTGETGPYRVIYEAESRYGRADIRVEGKSICHIIELKLDEADHKIVGQVMKYARAAGSRLHYGLYEDINMITVAKSYTESAILDLRAIGAKIYKYSLCDKNMSFELI